VTYNFDVDQWYENQRRLIEARKDRGELEEAAYQAELDALEVRYEQMTDRLNRSYELPESSR
jgi:hypothetical protein